MVVTFLTLILDLRVDSQGDLVFVESADIFEVSARGYEY